MRDLSAFQRRQAAKVLLTRISEAYGHMILREGLFQADCHPGNILVMKGGKVGLIDFGQSKQLTTEEVDAFARLVVAATEPRADAGQVAQAVWDLGIVTGRTDDGIKEVVARMAWDMFDTRGTVDPFSPNSPLKQTSIDVFPRDFFFVLRTCQLLRGLKERMEIDESWSSLERWRGLARKRLAS